MTSLPPSYSDLAHALATDNTLKYLQTNSILMKSFTPRFSKKTPDELVVLKKNEMSMLKSVWKVGK